MSNRSTFLFIFLLCFFSAAFSQNVGIGTTVPNSSAALDVQSTNKGMLVPRIALTSAADATPVTSPADALLVYNTATAGAGVDAIVPGFYYWRAGISRWVAISAATAATNTAGFCAWGDCSIQNVSEYNPVTYGTSLVVALSGNRFISGAPLAPNQSQRGLVVFGKIE